MAFRPRLSAGSAFSLLSLHSVVQDLEYCQPVNLYLDFFERSGMSASRPELLRQVEIVASIWLRRGDPLRFSAFK